MSADTRKPFERAVTDIASRQPALNPARHQVSPAVLEYRLQQVTEERDQLAAALTEILRACQPVNTVYQWSEDQRLAIRTARALLAKINAQPQAPTRSRP